MVVAAGVGAPVAAFRVGWAEGCASAMLCLNCLSTRSRRGKERRVNASKPWLFPSSNKKVNKIRLRRDNGR